MHIQPANQSYANQNQTMASNVAAASYSLSIQGTHDSNVIQQATSQINNVNQSNLQANYVNSAIPTQPTTIVQQIQPVLVQPIQATAQQSVVTNPNRNNVIYSEAGESMQNAIIFFMFS